VVACGGRRQAFDHYCTEIGPRGRAKLAFLLVDSESPVSAASPWDHVANRAGDGWIRPPDGRDDDLHFMVQCMESWLVADCRALKQFFGKGFVEKDLPARGRPVETVARDDVIDRLQRASTKTKSGAYRKGAHSFKLLGGVDPVVLRSSSPWAERSFATLQRRMP